MFREWPIADGPADLTSKDVGCRHTVKVTLGNGSTVIGQITFTNVGRIIAGNIRSFGGTLLIGSKEHKVFGTYNNADHTGHCQTTDT